MSQSDTPKLASVVGLGVGPELLADVFGRILVKRGLVVTRLPALEEEALAGSGRPPSPAAVDVALVYGLPEQAGAAVVVCLPDDDLGAVSNASFSVVVARPHSRELVQVAGVDGLVELLVELATGR